MIALLATAPATALAADAKAAPKPVEAGGQVLGRIEPPGFYRHTGTYPPFAVAWKRDDRVERALGVHPHPCLGARVVLVTAAGLVISEDGGATWRPLPGTGPDALGTVRCVAFAPEALDTFYLASDRRGLFITEDAGKTLRPLASKASGLASDETAAVAVYPGDRRWKSLLVLHGEAAPGLSYSQDAGRTWRVTGTDFFVRQVLTGGPGDQELFLVASRRSAKDIQGVYYAVTPDDFWMEVVRDVIPTDLALSLVMKPGRRPEMVFRGADPYLATADGGLVCLDRGGGARIGPPEPSAFACVGVAQGATADSQVLFAYDTRKLGMVASTDNFRTLLAQPGLPAGPFIREGARVRASADGATFYAVANDGLYVGRRAAAGPGIAQVAVTPAVFAFEREKHGAAMRGVRETVSALVQDRRAAESAKRLVKLAGEARAAATATEFTVTAQVAPATFKPAAVVADLSRLGGSPATPMLDDGRHGDGTEGDGTYGATFRLDPGRLRQLYGDWRRPWPGPVGVTVTAIAADGSLSGQVAPVSVFDRPESFNFTHGADTVVAKGEPWSKWWGNVYTGTDIDGFYAVSFWVKTDSPLSEEVFVQLQDTTEFSAQTLTPKVPLLKEGFVEGGRIGPEWRRVAVPLRRLLKDSPGFQARRLAHVVLSGEGRATGTYAFSLIRFYLSAEDAKAGEGVPPK